MKHVTKVAFREKTLLQTIEQLSEENRRLARNQLSSYDQ